MDEPFDDELAALRKEVGEFVLEVLKADQPAVIDRIADGLTTRLSERLKVATALSDRDYEAIDGLRKALGEHAPQRPGGPEATQWRSVAPSNLSEPPSEQQWFPRAKSKPGWTASQVGSDPSDQQEDTGEQEKPGWSIWHLVAAAVPIFVILILLIFSIVKEGPFRRTPSPEIATPIGDTNTPSGFQDAESWAQVMETVSNSQDERSGRELLALCGASDPVGCSLEQAEAHWAKDAPAAREAAAVIERVLNDQGVCRPPPQGQGPQEAQARLVSCLLRRPLQ